jgi:hypothetical protein
MKQTVRTLLEPLVRLLRRFFDPRFGYLNAQLDELRLAFAGADGMGAAAIPEGLISVTESLAVQSSVLRRLDQRLDADAESDAAVLEEARGIRRALDAVAFDSTGWSPWLDDMLSERGPDGLLTERQAEFLTKAASYEGPSRRAGLWFNPPVSVGYSKQGAFVSGVNERIVEVPFTFRALAGLPPGSTVLDVGAGESTVALSLACLGYRAIALDLHRYPLEHPNLALVAQPLEEWAGPEAPVDAVVCLSAIEHFGLGAYGEKPAADDADRAAMRRLHQFSAPGSLLVFTAPFGKAAVLPTQRVYDLPGLQELLDGWDVTDLSIARQTGFDRWELDADAVSKDGRGVALVIARRRP